MAWKYKNRVLEQIPEDYVGFIYLIRNIVDGRIYVGKKLFNSTRRSKIGKREKIAVPTRKKYKVIIKDSGWQDYNSSCQELKNDIKTLGEKSFTKTILELCQTKTQLNYKEVWWQFKYDVLETDSYNGNIACKYFKPKKQINEQDIII